MNWWLVAAGGALGTLARHAVGQAVGYPGAPAWPWATFAVNLVGSLALGLLQGLVETRLAADAARPSQVFLARISAFAGVGMLGGFTTYSAFSVEVVALVQAGALAGAGAYAGISVVAGIACAALGLRCGRACPAPAPRKPGHVPGGRVAAPDRQVPAPDKRAPAPDKQGPAPSTRDPSPGAVPDAAGDPTPPRHAQEDSS
ncbi:MAG: CrcB family protein [Bifidobacteriaceae bacterium]|nr:CrcB family protein [Bifidobacteriaceae bacterium]